MNGLCFFRIIDEAFAPFLGELGLQMDSPSISGRHYSVSFSGPSHLVSVSHEPGEAFLIVFVSPAGKKRLSDFDDKTRTPRLSDLNGKYMPLITNEERTQNEAFFRSVKINDDDEARLLKCAKELRLVLPKYLAQGQSRDE